MTERPTIAQLLVAELRDDPGTIEELREILAVAERGRLLKTPEAAEQLGVHPKTLTRAAGQGRVRGAIRVGSHAWRYRAGELELLPPTPTQIGPGSGGRGRRPAGESNATAAIRGTKAAA